MSVHMRVFMDTHVCVYIHSCLSTFIYMYVYVYLKENRVGGESRMNL